MITEILLTFVAGLAAVVTFFWLKNYRWRKTINLIPGPKALPFFGNALTMETDSAGRLAQLPLEML